LGNTVARLAKLAERSGFEFPVKNVGSEIWNQEWAKPFDEFRVDLVLQNIWAKLAELDKHINDNEPWKIQDKTKLKEVLSYEIDELRLVTEMLKPFIPQTAKKIEEHLFKTEIKSFEVLFPRL